MEESGDADEEKAPAVDPQVEDDEEGGEEGGDEEGGESEEIGTLSESSVGSNALFA